MRRGSRLGLCVRDCWVGAFMRRCCDVRTVEQQTDGMKNISQKTKESFLANQHLLY